MYKLFCFLLLIAGHLSNALFAQEKFEKESRIKQKDVPLKAQQFIDSLHLETKIKWYREEGLTGKSIESKFKYNNSKYSVEFDTLGNIEDIEIELSRQDLALPVRDSISFHLNKDCIKHKITKIQRQYSGSEQVLLAVITAEKVNDSPAIHYEIIVRCKLEKSVELFEYLFNSEGSPLSISKIVFKNSSHLEY